MPNINELDDVDLGTHKAWLESTIANAKEAIANCEEELKLVADRFKTLATDAVETVQVKAEEVVEVVQEKVEEVVEVVKEEVKKAAPKKAAAKKADPVVEEVAPEKDANSDQ